MSSDKDAPDLVEPEGVNAASADPEPANTSAEHVVGPPAAPPSSDDASVGNDGLLGPPDPDQDGPGQELAAGEG